MSDIHPSTAPSICRNRSCMRPFKSAGRAVHRRSTDLLKANKLNPTRALCLPHQLLSNGRAEKHGAAEAQQDVLRTGRAEKHARPYGLRRGDELTAAMLLLSSTVALNERERKGQGKRWILVYVYVPGCRCVTGSGNRALELEYCSVTRQTKTSP